MKTEHDVTSNEREAFLVFSKVFTMQKNNSTLNGGNFELIRDNYREHTYILKSL